MFICGERNRYQDADVRTARGRNPGPVLVGKRVVRVGCGESHVIVCTEDGTAIGWGSDKYGQAGSDIPNVEPTFGLGRTGQGIDTLKFEGAEPGSRVEDVGAGFFYSFAVLCAPTPEGR